jgi:hypothetical protein
MLFIAIIEYSFLYLHGETFFSQARISYAFYIQLVSAIMMVMKFQWNSFH